MPEHYTKNTLEATIWCNRCNAHTQHRVDNGRRGPCIPCIEKQRIKNEAERIRRGLEQEQEEERKRQNPTLF